MLEEAAKIPGSNPGGPTNCRHVVRRNGKVYYISIFKIRAEEQPHCRENRTYQEPMKIGRQERMERASLVRSAKRSFESRSWQQSYQTAKRELTMRAQGA